MIMQDALRWLRNVIVALLRIGGWPYRTFSWLVRHHWPDVRSAVVSALVGFFAGTLAWASGSPRQVTIVPSETLGYAVPMPALLEQLKDTEFKVSFQPANLKQVRVCEFAHLQGSTGFDMFLEYLSKYPECFTLQQTSEQAYVVQSGSALSGRKGALYCKCPVS